MTMVEQELIVEMVCYLENLVSLVEFAVVAADLWSVEEAAETADPSLAVADVLPVLVGLDYHPKLVVVVHVAVLCLVVFVADYHPAVDFVEPLGPVEAENLDSEADSLRLLLSQPYSCTYLL